MRITIAAMLALLAGAAAAEPTQLFYNERGQITGSSSTSGNVQSFLVRALCLILALVALAPQARAQPLPPDQACSEIVKTLDRITGQL